MKNTKGVGMVTSRLKVYAKVRGRLHQMSKSVGVNYKTLHAHLQRDKDDDDPVKYYVTVSSDNKAMVLKYHKMQPSRKVYYEH